MSLLALALALASAVTHAVWNLMVKRAGISANTPSFAWLLFALSASLFAPIAIWYVGTGRTVLTVAMIPWIAGSAALHTVAFLMLLRAYRTGDLSVVYPLSRGTGPLVVPPSRGADDERRGDTARRVLARRAEGGRSRWRVRQRTAGMNVWR